MSRPEILVAVPAVVLAVDAGTVDSMEHRPATHTRTSRAATTMDRARVDTETDRAGPAATTMDRARVDTETDRAGPAATTMDRARVDTETDRADPATTMDRARVDMETDRADPEWVDPDRSLEPQGQVILEIQRPWAETRVQPKSSSRERNRFTPARTRSRHLARQSFTETRRRKPLLQA